MNLLKNSKVITFIRNALEEDIGDGDITTNACVPNGKKGLGIIYAKESCVVAGLPIFALVFHLIDPKVTY